MPKLARREEENRYYARYGYDTSVNSVERSSYSYRTQDNQQSHQNHQYRGSQLRSQRLSADQKRLSAIILFIELFQLQWFQHWHLRSCLTDLTKSQKAFSTQPLIKI